MQLPVTEIFHSIQGEGGNVGRSAWFIRLGGCNLNCCGCDEPLKHDANNFTLMEPAEIAAKLYTPAELVIVTGGEPTLYNLEPLLSNIHEATKNWRVGINGVVTVCLETNGTRPIRGSFDYVAAAPKPASHGIDKFVSTPALDLILTTADEIKLVVGWLSEEEIIKEVERLSELDIRGTIYLSPLTQFPGNTLIPETAELAVKLVKQLAHFGVRLSLQTHKWIQIR